MRTEPAGSSAMSSALRRMQETLVRQEGIKAATVTFSVPESSSYIWDESNQQKSTGNVTVQMKPGYELTPERVSAIKHLASTSIPKLDPEDVVVIDAATGVEMPGVDDAGSEGYYSVRRLEYERAISKQIEDNVKRLLSGKYGADGVTAVATVSLNYDKMVSETKQFQAQDGTNSGVISHFDESYTLNGEVAAEGIFVMVFTAIFFRSVGWRAMGREIVPWSSRKLPTTTASYSR